MCRTSIAVATTMLASLIRIDRLRERNIGRVVAGDDAPRGHLEPGVAERRTDALASLEGMLWRVLVVWLIVFLLAAALQAECPVVLSEDLQHGQTLAQCKDWGEAAQLQQAWLRQTFEDYVSEGQKLMELGASVPRA